MKQITKTFVVTTDPNSISPLFDALFAAKIPRLSSCHPKNTKLIVVKRSCKPKTPNKFSVVVNYRKKT
jgi:hypothetical protein